jgi:hypothetical protein
MSVDFYVALVVFIVIVVYFLFQISTIVPTFINQIEEQRMMSEAYQVSEILLNDIGQPKNWDTLPIGQISRFGMSDHNANKTNLIAISKANSLNFLCLGEQGYKDVKHRMGMREFNFSVFVTNRQTGSIEVTCFNPSEIEVSTGLPKRKGFTATANRILAFNDGTYGDMKVQVWKS